MGKICKIVNFLMQVGLINTLLLNFIQLPFKQAIHLPIIVFRHCRFLNLKKGKIIIDGKIQTGMIRLGKYSLGFCDPKYDRTIWNNSGTVVFKGKTIIAQSNRIGVGKNAILLFGENFSMTGLSTILAQKEITFGKNCLIAWDVLIMDTDWHKIKCNGAVGNENAAIHFGDHIWIGARTTILKGVNIADNTVIASNSLVTKSIETEGSIFGSSGSLREIKNNIIWGK